MVFTTILAQSPSASPTKWAPKAEPCRAKVGDAWGLGSDGGGPLEAMLTRLENDKLRSGTMGSILFFFAICTYYKNDIIYIYIYNILIHV